MNLLNPGVSAKPIDYWQQKHRYYYGLLSQFYQFAIPAGSRIVHIGCKNGYLLQALSASIGVGIDIDEQSLTFARQRYPHYKFVSDFESFASAGKFDYVIISSMIMEIEDIQELFEKIRILCTADTRLIIDWYSALWEPALWIGQKLGLKRPTMFKNWLSKADMQNLLHLAGYEQITRGNFIMLPMYLPGISWLLNNVLSAIPLLDHLCLGQWVTARPLLIAKKVKPTVSVIIPCRNEKGNLEAAVKRIPLMGAATELIFVEGHSKDGTLQELERLVAANPERNITYFVQDGIGKGDAVRKGFACAKGDILMIQDADLTAPPEELVKFYNALVQGKGEFINGSRLVYGMESQAMRFLNLIANHCFGILFSWLLGQKIKDTLCGTKVLFKRHYDKIAANRSFFGDFDPFGDFDLLFGAAKQQLKIIDMPVQYKNRTYGTTQISRFYHGFLLLKMSLIALLRFKFRIKK